MKNVKPKINLNDRDLFLELNHSVRSLKILNGSIKNDLTSVSEFGQILENDFFALKSITEAIRPLINELEERNRKYNQKVELIKEEEHQYLTLLSNAEKDIASKKQYNDNLSKEKERLSERVIELKSQRVEYIRDTQEIESEVQKLETGNRELRIRVLEKQKIKNKQNDQLGNVLSKITNLKFEITNLN